MSALGVGLWLVGLTASVFADGYVCALRRESGHATFAFIVATMLALTGTAVAVRA